MIEILRLILQFFWRELDDFNIYNFPEDRDIDIIPDGHWTKAKTSITVDDHLHARVREPKGNAWTRERKEINYERSGLIP